MSTMDASRCYIPRLGAALKIQEDDYRYGEGELVIRVTGVGEVLWLDDGQWLMVVGAQIGWNGAEVCIREVAVRMSGLVRLRGRR